MLSVGLALERCRVLYEAGVYRSVAPAMAACPENVKVQENACLVLRHMCGTEPDTYDEVLRSGCVPLLTSARITHRESNRVQLNGCTAMWNFAAVSQALCE
eukprot:6301158-Prymnesium_polylepis.2